MTSSALRLTDLLYKIQIIRLLPLISAVIIMASLLYSWRGDGSDSWRGDGGDSWRGDILCQKYDRYNNIMSTVLQHFKKQSI
jgi:hypothetical protein